MATYRVAVIGHTGKGNYGHGIDSVWLHMPNCEIVGVADPHESGLAAKVKALKAPRGFSDYRKLLDETKPDIVSICPRWLDQHRDMVLAAAERGIHVYMEKPMCRTLAEADEMIDACEQNNVKAAIAFQTRYSPLLQTIRDLIEDGKIGRVLELRARGKEDRRGGGEDTWVLGSHLFNLMHYFGGEPEWCFASVLSDGKPITKGDVVQGNEGIGELAGDAIRAMYGMDEGVTGYFASHRQPGGRRFGLQILGSGGIIDLVTGYLPKVTFLPDPTWSPGRSGQKWLPVSSQGIGKPEVYTDPSHAAGNIAACTDLIQAIEDDRYPEASLLEGRVTVEMTAGIFESARVGRPVTIPLKTRVNPLTLL